MINFKVFQSEFADFVKFQRIITAMNGLLSFKDCLVVISHPLLPPSLGWGATYKKMVRPIEGGKVAVASWDFNFNIYTHLV